MKKPQRVYSISAVDRVAAILNAVGEGDVGGRSLKEISEIVSLGESTTLRYLSSLSTHDLILRSEDTGKYTLGLQLFRLGQQAMGTKDVRLLALPFMEKLLKKYEETVNLAACSGSRLVVIDVLESGRSIRLGASIGDLDQWHASALGKSILAVMDDDRAMTRINEMELVRFTPRTIVSGKGLIADLDEVRKRGYAIDDEEYEDGLRCVAAAIRDQHGRPAFAISISGFSGRMSIASTHKMGLDVLAAAAAISTQLGHVPLQEVV